MKYFNKIKKITEAKTPRQQRDDEIDRVQKDLEDQERENETRNKIAATGDMGDQQLRAPVNPDGSPVTTSDIEDMHSKEPIDAIGGTGSSSWGIGTHGSDKKSGIINKLIRGTGHLKSMSIVAKKGAAILPVKDDIYEDERGKLRRFSEIKTGSAAGNPYYFEFIHYDEPSKQTLVLYGTAPGGKEPGGDLKPIPVSVKAIVPTSKKDVSPMTAPTDDNVQPNKITEDSQAVKDAKRNKQVNVPKNIWNSPRIQRMIDNFKNTNRVNLKIKIGGTYGSLIRKDPGDGDSMLKLVRSIPRTHIPKIFLDDDFVAEIERIYSIPTNPDANRAVAAIGLSGVTSGALSTNVSRGSAIRHVGSVLGLPEPTKTSEPLALPSSGDDTNVIDIQPTAVTNDAGDFEYNDGQVRASGISQSGNKPGTFGKGHVPWNSGGTMGKSEVNQAASEIMRSPLDLSPSQSTPAPTPPPGVKSPLDLEEKIKNISNLTRVRITESSLGEIIGRSIARGERTLKQIFKSSQKEIDRAIEAYAKESGKEINDADKHNIIAVIQAKMIKAKEKIKSSTDGLHKTGTPAPDNDIKGDPAGAPYDEPDAIFVGDDPAGVGEPSKPAGGSSSIPEPKPEAEPEPEPQQPEEKPLPTARDISDDQLEKYVMQLIDGYRKFTLPKPTPKQMIHGNEASFTNAKKKKPLWNDHLEEDSGFGGSNRMVYNSFLHFAGWNFWPDLTYSDVVSMSLDSIYDGAVFTSNPDNIADHMNNIPSQFVNKDVEHTKYNQHIPAADHGAHIRKVLGQYYNIGNYTDRTNSYTTWIKMSDHPGLLYHPSDSGGARAFSQPKSSDNPEDSWYKSKWKPPKAMDEYDSVLQYLAHDIYTRYKVNILSPTYKFKLQHFKEDEEPDPMDPGYEVKPNSNYHKPTPSTSGAKRGKFFSGPAPKPGQFGSDLPTTTPTGPTETDKEKIERRKRRGRKRLEESNLERIKKLVNPD